MTVIDLTNISAAAFKGWNNAGGVEVDPAILGYIFAGSVATTGIHRAVAAARNRVHRTGRRGNRLDDVLQHRLTKYVIGAQDFSWDEPSPLREGFKGAGLRAAISGAEILTCYFAGYGARLASRMILS